MTALPVGDSTALLKQASTEFLEVKHWHRHNLKLRGKHGNGDEALPEKTRDCCILRLAAVGTGVRHLTLLLCASVRGTRAGAPSASQGTSSMTRAPSPAAVTGMIRLAVRAA